MATKPFDTAMEQNKMLTSHGLETNMSYVQCDYKEDVLLSDSDYFIRLIGRVIYLTIKWSYICFAVDFNLVYALSQKITHGCSSSNGEISWEYYRFGDLLPVRSPLCILAYCKSDWVACSWRASLLLVIALNLGIINFLAYQEVENCFQALCKCRVPLCEIIWILGLLTDTGVKFAALATLYCDNKTAIQNRSESDVSEANETHRDRLSFDSRDS